MCEHLRQLLTPLDIAPVRCLNPAGRTPFLLLGDHAGNAVPARLGGLGLDPHELDRHIGWDIGVAKLGAALSRRLDATFLSQAYSRLVIDCNREPARTDAVPVESDETAIPGNRHLTSHDRLARVTEIHEAYHQTIDAELARRDGRGEQTVVVSLHSFTPRLAGQQRPWDIGILYDGGATVFARAVLDAASSTKGVIAAANQPYAMDDTDYTIPRHAYAAGRPYVEIEVRQDLLMRRGGPELWAARLGAWLTASAQQIDQGGR